eukprot:gene12453-biopygen7579
MGAGIIAKQQAERRARTAARRGGVFAHMGLLAASHAHCPHNVHAVPFE